MNSDDDEVICLGSRPAPMVIQQAPGSHETNQASKKPSTPPRSGPQRRRKVSKPSINVAAPELPPTPIATPEDKSAGRDFGNSSSRSPLSPGDKHAGSPRAEPGKRPRLRSTSFKSIEASSSHDVTRSPDTALGGGPDSAEEGNMSTTEHENADASRPCLEEITRRNGASEPNPQTERMERAATKAKPASYSGVSGAKHPHQIDADIATKIRSGPYKYKSSGMLQSVYILPAILTNSKTGECISVMKIGRTRHEDVSIRHKQISLCGDITVLLQDPDSDLPKVLYSDFIEKLAQAELFNFRHLHECSCKKRHREYFQVGEEMAYDVVRRWIKFCEHQPWDYDTQKLLPAWDRRLEKRKRCTIREEKSDHVARCKRWNSFVHSNVWGWMIVEELPLLFGSFWHWKWQLLSLWNSLLVITGAANRWGWCSLILVTIFLMFDEMPKQWPLLQFFVKEMFRMGKQPSYSWEKIASQANWNGPVDEGIPLEKQCSVPGAFGNYDERDEPQDDDEMRDEIDDITISDDDYDVSAMDLD